MENIVYRNIKVANVRSIFDFNLNWRPVGGSNGPRMATTVKNVYILNVTGSATNGGGITGLPDSPITNILFENCDLKANSPLRLSNTANLDTKGLKLTVPMGEGVISR